jgi:hypothetical protein
VVRWDALAGPTLPVRFASGSVYRVGSGRVQAVGHPARFREPPPGRRVHFP